MRRFLFLSICLVAGLMTSFFFHKIESAFKKSLEILFTQEESNVVDPPEDFLGSYLNKQLSLALKQYQKEGKSAFLRNYNTLEVPSQWFFTRKGKLIHKQGMHIDSPWIKNWEKHFFLGLYKGEKTFQSKVQYFYPRYISRQDFLSWDSKIQFIYDKGKQLAFYFKRDQDLLLFILIDWEKFKDHFQMKQLGVNEAVEKEPVKFDLLSWAFFSMFFLTLLQPIIRRALFSNFRRKLAVMFLLLFLVCGWLLEILTQLVIASKLQELLTATKQDLQKQVLQIESGFTSFQKGLENTINEQLQTSAKMDFLASYDFFNGVEIRPNGIKSVFPEEVPFFFVEVAKQFAPAILINQPELQNLSWNEIKGQFYKEGAVNPLIQSTVTVHERMRSSFTQDREGLLIPHGATGIQYIFLFKRVNLKDHGFSIFFLGVRKHDLHHNYLKQTSFAANLPFKFSKLDKAVSERSFLKDSKLTVLLYSAQFSGSFLYEIDLSREIKALQRDRLLLHASLVLAFLLATIWWFMISRKVNKEVAILRHGFVRLKEERFERLDSNGQDEFRKLRVAFNQMLGSLEEKNKVSAFVAGQILELMTDKSGNLLHSLESNAVVLFSDIRSFTSLTETHDPQEIVDMLNEYFELWQSVIQKYDGVIERFIGDAVVAVFFEKSSSHYCQNAIQSAIQMSMRLEEFNSERLKANKFTISNGVGLAHGLVRFAVIGNEVKRHLSTLSETSERAEKLEALTRSSSRSNILADGYLHSHCQHNFDFVPSDTNPDLYEVLLN